MASSVLRFRPFSLRRQSLCPLSTHSRTFYSFLLEELKRLEQSLVEGPISLRWLAEAMNLLKRMQIELHALFKDRKLPIAIGAEDDWFNQYMQETATLLDLCNSLKSTICGINRYRMVVDLAVQKIAQGNSSYLVFPDEMGFGKEETRRVETIRVGLEIKFQANNNSKTNRSITSVMLAAKCTVIVVSVLLVSAVAVSPLSIDIGSEELASKFPQMKPFLEMLRALVARFQEKASKPRNESKFVLAEREVVDIAVGDLRAQAMGGVVDGTKRERFMKSAEILRTSSDELREGIEMFDAVVDEVFEVVVKGRNEMLEVFRDGVLSLG